MICVGNRPPLILWKSVLAHKKNIRVSKVCLNPVTSGYLEGTVVRIRPIVWSLALCPGDAKQNPVVYGAEFGVTSSVPGDDG